MAHKAFKTKFITKNLYGDNKHIRLCYTLVSANVDQHESRFLSKWSGNPHGSPKKVSASVEQGLVYRAILRGSNENLADRYVVYRYKKMHIGKLSACTL